MKYAWAVEYAARVFFLLVLDYVFFEPMVSNGPLEFSMPLADKLHHASCQIEHRVCTDYDAEAALAGDRLLAAGGTVSVVAIFRRGRPRPSDKRGIWLGHD